MKRENTVDFHIRSTWHTIQKFYNEWAGKYDSTMVTGWTLLTIDPRDGTPSTELGPLMGVERTSLSRTLKNLEEKKLIYREPNPKDGRSVLIKLTDEGIKMRDVSKIAVLKLNESIQKELSHKELNTLISGLETIEKTIIKQTKK